MRRDFAINKIFDTVSDKVHNRYGLSLTDEQVEMFVDLFIDGMFKVIQQDKDIQIPRFGTFHLSGPQYAAYLKIREMTSNGCADIDLIREECSRVARDTAIEITRYNKRMIKPMRGGELYSKRVHHIPELKDKQLEEYRIKKGVKTIVITGQWLQGIKNSKNNK